MLSWPGQGGETPLLEQRMAEAASAVAAVSIIARTVLRGCHCRCGVGEYLQLMSRSQIGVQFTRVNRVRESTQSWRKFTVRGDALEPSICGDDSEEWPKLRLHQKPPAAPKIPPSFINLLPSQMAITCQVHHPLAANRPRSWRDKTHHGLNRWLGDGGCVESECVMPRRAQGCRFTHPLALVDHLLTSPPQYGLERSDVARQTLWPSGKGLGAC